MGPDPKDLVLGLRLFGERGLQACVKSLLLLVRGLVQGQDLMALVVLIQDTVYAENFLVHIAEGFKLLGMCGTVLRGAV